MTTNRDATILYKLCFGRSVCVKMFVHLIYMYTVSHINFNKFCLKADERYFGDLFSNFRFKYIQCITYSSFIVAKIAFYNLLRCKYFIPMQKHIMPYIFPFRIYRHKMLKQLYQTIGTVRARTHLKRISYM